GGPSLLLFSNGDMQINGVMFLFLIKAIDELSRIENVRVCVLTPYVDTLTFLQQNLKSRTSWQNYLVETVDRVQGLDVDYCFFVVPKIASFSFNENRFNVATSRSRKCTFILTIEDYSRIINLPNTVSTYMQELVLEFA